MEINSIIKIWNDGNLQIGCIKTKHSHPILVHYEVVKTIIAGSDYNSCRHEEISSKSNIITDYGIITINEHKELYPEDWI